MFKRIAALVVPTLLMACTVVETEGRAESQAPRGELGKADLVGTCELPNGNDLCGGHGKGNCWCDEACVDYGDCCADAADVCGLDVPPPAGEACGGLAGLTGADGQTCMFEEDAFCGFADALGTCVDTPEFCIELFAPVCGCDGQTYSNSCFALAAGTSVASQGECESEPQFCGGFAGLPCPEGMSCVDDPDDSCDPANGGADCGGICVPDSDGPDCQPVLCALFCEHGFATDEDGCEVCSCAEPPEPTECMVGGCSGELCHGPDEPGISICIFKPEYACLEFSACGNFGADGGCGWEQTQEYVDCMAQFE